MTGRSFSIRIKALWVISASAGVISSMLICPAVSRSGYMVIIYLIFVVYFAAGGGFSVSACVFYLTFRIGVVSRVGGDRVSIVIGTGGYLRAFPTVDLGVLNVGRGSACATKEIDVEKLRILLYTFYLNA